MLRTLLVLVTIFSTALRADTSEHAVSEKLQSKNPSSDFIRPKVPPGTVYHHDINIGEIAGVTLSLDIARPVENPGKIKRPAIVYIYGGAWRRGDKNKFANTLVRDAKQGRVGVAIMYRPSPEHTFPAQVDDVKTAIRFLKVNAGKYGIDPDRIIVIGSSAGGHLAAMLAVTGNDDSFATHGLWTEADSSVYAAVNFSGPTALFLDEPYSQWESLTLFLGGVSTSLPDIARAAMPISYIDKDDPPMFIAHVDADNIIPVQMSREFVAALEKEGVPHQYMELPGGTHKLSKSHPQTYQSAQQFIQQLLNRKVD